MSDNNIPWYARLFEWLLDKMAGKEPEVWRGWPGEHPDGQDLTACNRDCTMGENK